MPLQKLQFRAGLNREGTDYANEGGWYDGDKIRFRSGFPEKIGGWTRLSNESYLGTARSLWNWVDLAGNDYLGIGTNLKYYIEKGGVYFDVTPVISTQTFVDKLSTAYSTLTAGINATTTSIPISSAAAFPPSGGLIKIDSEQILYSAVSGNNLIGCTRGYNGTIATTHTITTGVGCATVTFVDASNTADNGDYIIISGSTGIGGISAAAINASEQVVESTPAGTYYFTTSEFSTSQVIGGGGTITVQFLLHVGADTYTIGTGWGAGPWSPYNATNLTNPFTAASTGVSTLTVTQTAHGLTTGDYVYFFSIGADPCGIPKAVMQKAFPVTVTGLNTYTISTVIGGNTYTTTSTAASGGTVTVYQSTGTPRGWGAAYSSGLGTQLRLWSNDNYGQNLLIAPRGGSIYYWQAATGLSTRAQSLASLSTAYYGPTNYVYGSYTYGQYVPTETLQVVASAIQRFVIALGANSFVETDPNTTFDPMLVRWSDQGNEYNWVPAVTNQAGEFRLTNGSYIMAGRATRQEILVWTNSAIYSMQYLGAPYVWGFQILMDNISVMSPNSMVTVNNVTYWMGTDKFYMYSGRVETLPCSLRQYIFDDINKDQSYQVFCGSNEGYNEVWWFYCSNNSTTVDKYVIYNYLDRVWYYGTLARTAWLDSGIRQYPMAAGYTNRILYHESAVDDVSGLTPEPIVAYCQSSDFDIGDGHNFGFVWRILPDVNFNGSNVNQPEVKMTIKPRVNSGTPYGTADTPTVQSDNNYTNRSVYTVQEFDGQVYTRLRARQMSFRIESDSLGVSWQLGTPRIDIRPDGRR